MKLETLYGQPWMIRQDVWHRFHVDTVRMLKSEASAAPRAIDAPMMAKRPPTDRYGDEFAKMEMRGKTAIVPVAGALMKGATGSDKWAYSVVSHEDIDEDIDSAIAKGAKSFLFKFNSPGGTVMGTPETSDRIAKLSKQGYATAGFTSDLCCSAAYYMAAGCQALFCTPSAVVGSIGTIWETMNFAGMLEQLGIGWDVFTSGPFKGTGHPARELTPEQSDWMQSVVNNMSKDFKGHVTQHRKAVGPETMQGQIFTGREAAANGLFDANVSSMEEALALVS